jgi:hypothetical protein
MTTNHDNDLVSIGRYVDGEMTATEQFEFEARQRAEPAFADLVAEAEGLRAVFAVGRSEPAPALRPGLAQRVLGRLQRGDSGDVRIEVERRIVKVARACLLAAAAVLAVATLFATGVLGRADGGQLQADAGAELIRTLDAEIQAAGGAGRPGGSVVGR